MKTTSTTLIAVALLVAAVSSCKKETTNNNSAAKSYLNFVNASPTEQNPDLYIPSGSAPLTSDFYYGMSTGYSHYLGLTDQVITIKDLAHGTVLTTANLAGVNNAYYSWFMYDSFPNLKYFLTKDDLPTGLASGKGAIKFVNLSPNAGPVTYRIAGGGATLASNIQYAGTNPNACTSAFIPVDTGYIAIEVLDSTLTVIDNLPLYQLYVKPGKGHLLWTMGYRGATAQYALAERYTLGTY